MDSVRRLILDCAIMLGVGIVLALLGPFGSFGVSFGTRLLYWIGVSFAGFALYKPAMTAAARLAPRLDLPELAVWLAAGAFATIPMAALIWCLNFLWRAPRWPGIDEAVGHYGNVLLLGLGVSMLFYFLRGRPQAARQLREAEPVAPAPPPAPAPPDAAFLDRLPPHLGRDVIALEMEDHYVRAHTPLGSALVLMRMRDAVAELDGIAGAQVHRSWWVARVAVKTVRRDGRNYRLILPGGVEAPVARANVAALQAAGWFAQDVDG